MHRPAGFDWNVHLVGTGEKTMTGGRLLRLKNFLHDDPVFMLTYGDGVANVDDRQAAGIPQVDGKIATVTAVRPTARFGGLELDGSRVVAFREKPQLGEGRINGGFFVFNSSVFDYRTADTGPRDRADGHPRARGELMTYRHEGFWMHGHRPRATCSRSLGLGDAPWTWPGPLLTATRRPLTSGGAASSSPATRASRARG